MNIIKVNAGKHLFVTEAKDALSVAKISPISEKDGVYVYKADFVFANGLKSGTIGVTVRFPMKNILQVYSPVSYFKRNRMVWQWFNPSSVISSFASGMPSLSAVREGKNNYVTVAASDADHKCTVEFFADDFFGNDEVAFRFWLFQNEEKRNSYSVFIRIDERDILLSQTLKEQTAWFGEFYPQPKDYPEASEYPLYSTWYNYHQNPSSSEILEELKIARDIGFKSVILDDGWQMDGPGNSIYDECGDWGFSKEKFPDPTGFVESVHALGMKIALWYPVPFVGFKTKDFQRFKDKILYSESYDAGVLDVRYKEVRDYIINNVKKLMGYGFDGMKLDFIDSFTLKKTSAPFNPETMDFEDVTVATVRLISDLHDAIKEINSEAMIELRQDDVGPSIARFGNMLRVGDCAFDSITNRIGIADMRMLGYNLAVHSDMLYWTKTETDENVSKQLLNIMYGVPQISVLLKKTAASHLRLIKNFIEYWEENKTILLHGEFFAEGEECTYSILSAKGKSKDIVTLYLKNHYEYYGKRTDLFNGTNEDRIYVDTGELPVKAKVFDCRGEMLYEKDFSGVIAISVPSGGRIEIKNKM